MAALRLDKNLDSRLVMFDQKTLTMNRDMNAPATSIWKKKVETTDPGRREPF